MKINKTFKAAVLHTQQSELQIQQLTIEHIGADEVLVRNQAAGLCHSDLEVIDGQLASHLPIVLGHENCGIVEAVGENVKHLSKGDQVIASWRPSCGHCFYCQRQQTILCEEANLNYENANSAAGQQRLQLKGADVGQFMFIGGFSEYSVLHHSSAIKIPTPIDPAAGCLIGCGVMTGAGAVFNIAQVKVAETVVVIGCGGVGMSAVNAAAIAGAKHVIAVDINDDKLELAKECGATTVVNPKLEDLHKRVMDLTESRGADHVIEAAGIVNSLQTAVDVVRPGGNLVILGKTQVDKKIELRWGSLMQEKNIRRNSYGGAEPARDFPLLAELYQQKKLKLDSLISESIKLEDINQAFQRMREGKVLRSVIRFD